jgi:hypothetical protein
VRRVPFFSIKNGSDTLSSGYLYRRTARAAGGGMEGVTVIHEIKADKSGGLIAFRRGPVDFLK